MNAQSSNLRPVRFERSGKIAPHHLDRLAVIYVRQSTLQQVERHRESTRLQYGLVEWAVQLGWPQQRTLVIDEDLGRSGASAEGRPGFQRLVAEVGMDHVGIVLGIEMSRLARSSRDWYQLLEICALFATLIGDLDGIYDPMAYNDRLLLGLKGTMSEAELHILKQRMLEGKWAKARRGELGMPVPMGYVRQASGEVIKDPDEQAQGVIARVFELFERLGTLHGVLRYLVEHQIHMPCRQSSGPAKGELQWRRPNRNTLSNLLHNPIYAGAYVYGRRPSDPRKKVPGRPSTGRTVAKVGQWEVLIKDRFPSYISWQQYERNVRQLEANTAQGLGGVRHGVSLLSGLLICGRCGLRMATQYSNNGQGLRYNCSRMASDYGEAPCQSLAGGVLDEQVTQLVFQALEAAALEISLQVAEDLEAERAQEQRHWEQRLERAHYEVERAFRQYDAVEPENRLVARTLERRWEQALADAAQLKQAHDRYLAEQPTTLSVEERNAIRCLAEDIPALWRAETTTAADRQTIVRYLIERILVTVVDESEKVQVEVHWVGGHQTRTRLTRPVARLEQMSNHKALLARVKALQTQGHNAAEIAQVLNTEGWHPPKRRDTYNAPMVRTLLSRLGLGTGSDKQQHAAKVKKRAQEWTLKELSRKLEMPEPTLYAWLRKGELNARKVHTATRTLWLVRANKAELARLRERRTRPRTWLKTPSQRNPQRENNLKEA